jgi:hypothetical protein
MVKSFLALGVMSRVPLFAAPRCLKRRHVA